MMSMLATLETQFAPLGLEVQVHVGSHCCAKFAPREMANNLTLYGVRVRKGAVHVLAPVPNSDTTHFRHTESRLERLRSQGPQTARVPS